MDWAKKETLFNKSLANQLPSSLALSADGRYVSWVARGEDIAGPAQVWRGEVDSGKVELVSVATDGVSEADGNCKSAAFSADGRFVAFASLASNLVADDTNNAKDVFLRDLQTGQTLLVSRTPAGTPGNGWSLQPFFSADGRSLFFLSHAPDLAPGDYNQGVDLFKIEILADSGLLAVIQRNLNTGQARLLWNGAPEKSYQIQFKDDLRAGEWSTVPGTFTGEGGVDISPTSPHRFFRVVELP